MNFLKKIFSPSCLIISIFILIYTFYKSQIVFDGERSEYYRVYYIISAVLIIFSILTFFLNQIIKEYLIITIVSILFSVYCFEAYLPFKDNQKIKNKEITYKEQTGRIFDKRYRSEIYKDLKKTDKDIKVIIYPYDYIKNYNDIYPLSGISNSKTISCNENGYYSIYKSDRYGFNNPDSEWDANKKEFLIVGDSFALGDCVNRPDDIGSVLRHLSNKSVLNLGYSGHNPLLEYATLREYYVSGVNKVLWLYYEGNDLQGLSHKFENKFFLNYIKDLNFKQDLKVRHEEINILGNNILSQRIKEKRNVFKLGDFIKLFNTRYLITNKNKKVVLTYSDFEKIIKLSKELVSRNNSKFYFVYLPEFKRYKGNYENNSYLYVKKIIDKLGIPFIDIHAEVFKNESNPLDLFPFNSNGHYNESGYNKVARAIYRLTQD